MTELFAGVARFLRQFRLYVLVMPWERAVRVRLGRHTRVLAPGWHWKVPFADRIYVQGVRLRAVVTPTQTLTTVDGRNLTLAFRVLFALGDILKVYERLDQPEDVLLNLVAGEAARYVRDRRSDAVRPEELERALDAVVDRADYGLSEVNVRITDFAFVHTYRLLMDQPWSHGGSLELAREVGDGVRLKS